MINYICLQSTFPPFYFFFLLFFYFAVCISFYLNGLERMERKTTKLMTRRFDPGRIFLQNRTFSRKILLGSKRQASHFVLHLYYGSFPSISSLHYLLQSPFFLILQRRYNIITYYVKAVQSARATIGEC